MVDESTCWKPFNKVNSQGRLDIVRGEGVYLYDSNGQQYIDAYSGLWNMHYGYSDQDIKNAIIEQMNILPYANPITINYHQNEELSTLLCTITHDEISKIIYTCTGSESIEAAIKISRKYSALKDKEKHLIAVMPNSYHGSYYGAMSASGYENSFKEGYGPMLDGFVTLPLPFCRCCKSGNVSDSCLKEMLDTLYKELDSIKDKLCGVLIEPVIASGGVMELPKEYLLALSQFCKNEDILLICDEVATGFGRTGSMFCFQKYNIKPDIITLSKGINNGYLPLGAVCVTKKIVREFIDKDTLLFHLSTQNGNPICIAAAIANIKKMLSENITERVNILSSLFKEMLLKELDGLNNIHDIRISGLMIAIDIVNPDTNKPISQEELSGVQQKIYMSGCIAGCSYVEGITSSVLILPPFILKKNEVKKIVRIMYQSLMI